MSAERRRRPSTSERLRLLVPLTLAWGGGLAVLAGVAVQPEGRAGELLLDPAATARLPWYTGLVSNLGVLSWTVAVCAGVTGAWLCRMGARPAPARFLASGSAMGALLLVDDLIQFHVVVPPRAGGLGKLAVESALGAGVLGWAWAHRAQVRRTHAHLLVAAAAALAVSVVVDALGSPGPGDRLLLVEDGAKLLGTLAWSTYFVVTTRDVGRSVLHDASERPAVALTNVPG